MHLGWRFSRGMTLGVRGAVLSPEGEVFLVRHTYVPGWHLPGGGVEPGETMQDALARELLEEAQVVAGAPPVLHGIFLSHATARDHVAVYVLRDYRLLGPRAGDAEIAEAGFFPLDALPDGVTAATVRRIAEITAGEPVRDIW